jgi:hypothetical protein
MRAFTSDPNRPTCNSCDYPMMFHGAKTEAGKRRYRCGKCGTSTAKTKTEQSESLKGYCEDMAAENAVRLKKSLADGCKRLIVTCACNNTPVVPGFLTALEAAAKDKGAELIVIPMSYKNISLYTGGEEYKKWWDSSLDKYLIDTEIKAKGIIIDGDTNIPATAANPISSFEDIGGQMWRVIGHPQVAMMPVSMPGDMMPKRVYTTGCLTKKNYSRTKAGKKGAFHHTHGALIIELGGKHPFVRQLNYDQGNGGGFYDLGDFYSRSGKVTRNNRITGLSTGDEHIKFFDKKVRKATYDDDDSIAKTLRPKYLIRQDIFDGYSVSHHHLRSPLKQYAKYTQGNDVAKAELEQVVEFLDATTPPDAINCIVASNHHDHLDLWLDRADAKTDHVNAHLILDLQKAQREAIDQGENPEALRLYLKPRVKSKIIFLDRNKPFFLNKRGADYGQHGDVGSNGSRGSAQGLAKSALKMTIGHSHGARIVRGVYQNGTSAGRMEYERGLSDHTNTHSIEYANGKRTLIDIIKGKWRGEA